MIVSADIKADSAGICKEKKSAPIVGIVPVPSLKHLSIRVMLRKYDMDERRNR